VAYARLQKVPALRKGQLRVAAEEGSGYITLIVRLQQDATGGWQVIADDAQTTYVLALCPATFIIRLHRQSGATSVRGTIRLQSGGQEVPLQSNLEQIEALVCAWLIETNRTAGA
jgi:hypothetical protein